MISFLRRLNESEKPKIIKNIESAFKGALWEDRPYDINDNDMYLLFDIINDGLFQNKLDRTISKFTLKAELIPSGPYKYKGMQNALAAFSTGVCKGEKKELIIVKHTKQTNFYIIVCALMHEMIHMFDYHFGPMGKQFDKYGAVSIYNFNYPYIDPQTGSITKSSADSNIKNAMFSRFKDIRQLPDEILYKITGKSKNDNYPRQYLMPGQKIRPGIDPDTGEDIPQTAPLDIKYKMDNLDGFYDVHGDFFMNIAKTINTYGFSITDVFTKETPRKMTKTYESQKPLNPAEALLNIIISDEHTGCDFKDSENWFIEIT